MAQIVEVPGVGAVEFPDEMSDDQIGAAIRRSQSLNNKVSARANIARENAGLVDKPNYLESVAAGAGKAFSDAGLGLKQMGAALGSAIIPSDMGTVAPLQHSLEAEAVAKRNADAPLMERPGSGVGQFLGGLATTAPALLIPGANTVAGASLVGGGLGAAQPAASGGERLMNVALGTTFGGTGQAVGGKIAQAAGEKLAGRHAASEAVKMANSERDRVAQAAMQAGYKFPPTTTNPTARNRVLESIAGKQATENAARTTNQQVTNALAREAVGLPKDAPLTVGALRGVRAKAGNVYERASSLGTIRVADDAQFGGEIDSLLVGKSGGFGDLGAGINEKIASLVKSLKQPEVDSADVVSAIRTLRANSKKNWKAAALDPDRGDLAAAQDSAVDSLESLLERHATKVGKPTMVKELRDARALYAKTYSVESALKKGSGDVLASRLAAQLDRNRPLTGPLRAIAETASTFDRATLRPRGSDVSHLDAVVSGGAGTAGLLLGDPMTALLSAAAWPTARYGARRGLLSNTYQANSLLPEYGPRQVDLLGLGAGGRQLGRTAPLVGLLGTDPEQQ